MDEWDSVITKYENIGCSILEVKSIDRELMYYVNMMKQYTKEELSPEQFERRQTLANRTQRFGRKMQRLWRGY